MYLFYVESNCMILKKVNVSLISLFYKKVKANCIKDMYIRLKPQTNKQTNKQTNSLAIGFKWDLLNKQV